ncbi:MAG: hypothetical protein P4L63_01195 [Candidatus Pacebacteria bacterium]|nr:hypothetical protein [Candidatus Paceibacterota bacterium]
MKKYPLYIYVSGVAVLWAIILTVVWSFGNAALFQTFISVSAGFALGMLYMYIRMKWFSVKK